MITRKLNKRQGYTVQILAVQLTQAQAAVSEAQEGLNELSELYRLRYELPEGEARFGQGPDGWSIVVTPKPEPKTPDDVPMPETDKDGDITDIVSSGKLPAPDIGVDGTEYHPPRADKPGPEETKAVEDA